MLVQLLKQIVAHRFVRVGGRVMPPSDLMEMANHIGHGRLPVDEVQEIIVLPEFDKRTSDSASRLPPDIVVLSPEVKTQCHKYVSLIASLYRDNPFHNFEVRVVSFRLVFLFGRLV